MIRRRPVPLVMWDRPRLWDPQCCSPARLLLCERWCVICPTFHIHLTFSLTRRLPKDRFVCSSEDLRCLADTHNVTITRHWNPCSTSPISHLPAALHHHLETPGTRQERHANRNCWLSSFYFWGKKVEKKKSEIYRLQNWKRRDQFDKLGCTEKWVLPCFNCTYWSVCASVS